MHRDILKVVTVWQHEVGVELETALLEAAKHPYDLVSRKEL